MSYTIVKIATREATDDHAGYLQQAHGPSHFIKTDAFTVLPPLSPKIPGPPPTPSPYRILPPIVSRKRPSFVILQELGSRPQSREPSPSGRVSPFRGYGFKPSPTSREPSPSRQCDSPLNETAINDKARESRSRLPVASKKTPTRKVSKSASPARPKSSGIPVPLNRRISSSPNRIKDTKSQKLPLKSSENILGRRPTVSESDLKSALRKSNTNITQIQTPMATTRKPPVPRQSKTLPKSCTPKSPAAKTPAGVGTKKIASTSPARRNLYLGKNEALKKIGEAGKDDLIKPSPIRSQILHKSPLKVISAKSKENLSPSSNPSTAVKTTKSPLKMTKLPSRPPVRTPKKEGAKQKVAGKVEDVGTKQKNYNTENEGTTVTATATVTAETSTPTTIVASSANDTISSTVSTNKTASSVQNEFEKSNKPPKAMVKHVGRKALTTGNLMAALKKTVNEVKNKSNDANNEEKPDERKDLPHMDTSRSLPISIATTNLTDSSVTLIRTTTEPALAPVEPELITEIRTALTDAKNSEEATSMQKEVKNMAAEAIGETAAADSTAVASSSPDVKAAKVEKFEEDIRLVESEKMMAQPTEKTQSKDSPHPVHVIAVTKIEEPKQEMTSTIVEIKQEADGEVQSSNTSNQSENRNGISKSSWLNERPQAEVMKNLNVRKLKENPSTENLVPKMIKTTRWHRFKSKCPKCLRRPSETRQVSISMVTKSDGESADIRAGPKDDSSCLSKYLFCVRCQCRKSLKGKRSPTEGAKRRCRPQWRCLRLKIGFKNVLDRVSCCRPKRIASSKFSIHSQIEDTEVACVSPPSEDVKCGMCARCSGQLYKCFGILCCVNSAVCVKVRGKCGTWCSCCKKCVCCGNRQKKVISEAERRKSTISMSRKRKWTRYFTDFPKLDASFVEHGSVMRGAIPVLPVPLAWICLILNVFLPGFGTLSSGIFCLFVGKPRFSINDSIFARIGAFVVNFLVASSQLFTVLFCLVGWGWSIWWGVMMLKMAKKNKRIILAEQGITATHLSPLAAKNRDAEKGAVSSG